MCALSRARFLSVARFLSRFHLALSTHTHTPRALSLSLAARLQRLAAPSLPFPALASAFSQVPTLRGAIEARTPLGRIGDPTADNGGVVAFLAGPDSGYVSGQTIVCDGGSFLGL